MDVNAIVEYDQPFDALPSATPQALTLTRLRNRQNQSIQKLLGFAGDFRQDPGVFDFDLVNGFQVRNEIGYGEFRKQIIAAQFFINKAYQQKRKPAKKVKPLRVENLQEDRSER